MNGNIRTIKVLSLTLVAMLCLTLAMPHGAAALEGLTVTLASGITLKEALAEAGYITKKGYVKIESLTLITEPGAALDGVDFEFIAQSLSNLTMLDISSSTITDNSIPPSALRRCDTLREIKLPDDVISIGSQAFDGCAGLQAIDLPPELMVIGDRAFAGCASLSEINIPKDVTIIGAMAFRGCKNLGGIHVDENNTGYRSVNGVLYTHDGKELHSYPANKNGVYSVLPGTEVIPPYAFADCGPNLTGITLPEGLETIGEYAFAGCTLLSRVTIPEGVGSIEYAFRGCKSLESVIFPKSLYFIGWETFSGCTALKEIAFNGPVERIGPLAFEKCTSLTDVYFSTYFPTSKIRSDAFSGCSKLKTVHVPAGTARPFRSQLRGKIGSARIVEDA